MANNAVFSIRPTDIKGCSYRNDFKVRPGEKVNIQVKTNLAVKTNPAQPTSAVVLVKFEAADANAGIFFEVETITSITADTFVDDLEGVIREEYLNIIMLAVNERIRAVAGTVGFNISVPAVNFGDKDNLVAFNAKKN